MDKSAIKSFAIEARKILMKSAITQAGFYGVSKDGCDQPTQKGAGFEVYRTIAGTDNRIFGDDIKRREKLVRAVEEKGFDQVIEETAYTWFNRLIAIRFMEVNGYLPTRTRVLSSETGSNTPDLMSQYMDVDLDMTMDELEKVQTCVRENRYDDAFALLFVKQCNALNDILPELFEKTTDYMELLLKLSYTSDGVVRMLVDTIPESNFDIEQEGQIEIIGWMYQYYNTELKDDTFALLKKNVKITKERIPSATQLFTPDWIVRYMVENSLGRLWIEGHPDEDLKANWKYYLEEAEQEADVQAQLEEIRNEYKNLNPEDIKVIDPCMGSGHILVYCFDVLMQIYESQGYTQRDAAHLILENNLYGLDIDKRATQLAYFAVMMKARQYDRRIFSKEVIPHIYVIEESNGINRNHLKYFGSHLSPVGKREALSEMTRLLDTFKDAKEYGAILNVEEYKWALLRDFVEMIDNDGQISFETVGIDDTREQLIRLIKIAEIMAGKYQVAITNPPYMGNSGMNQNLVEYLKKNYFSEKNDLYACMMNRVMKMIKKNGFYSMVTMESWMFLSGFETLRDRILSDFSLLNLVHMPYLGKGKTSMGISFGTVAFIARKGSINNYSGLGQCLRYYEMDEECRPTIFPILNERFNYYKQEHYYKVPGKTISYWVTQELLNAFNSPKLENFGFAYQGIITGKVDYFLKLWHEVDFKKVRFGVADPEILENINGYFPYVKGGEYRKWYGNHNYLIKWENNGSGLTRSRTENRAYFLRDGITWTLLTSGKMSFRYLEKGFLCDVAGSSYFIDDSREQINYTLAFLNSIVCEKLLDMINPTMNLNIKDVLALPLKHENSEKDLWVCNLVEENINIEKLDWDSSEISWNFKKHPLISSEESILEDIDKKRREEVGRYYQKLKSNERVLDEYFKKLYGTPDYEDDVKIAINNFETEYNVRSLISYAIGCILGRYSLDFDGLAYAGGEWDASRYTTCIPDVDNIIPITDEEYFSDDIVGKLCSWLKMVYGEESLEINLDFIAKTLGNKGNTSREVIRNYFLNDFMKDHMKIYQKRPIYWMFDSGKQNGFKCLTYMHRYDKDTVGRVRSDYLRKSQEAIEAALKNAEYTIQNSTSAIDKATATKKRDKYIKQLSEIRTYFQALSHVALQRIDIDLDDGVKVNYEKFQNIEIVDENGKKQKINLLAKI